MAPPRVSAARGERQCTESTPALPNAPAIFSGDLHVWRAVRVRPLSYFFVGVVRAGFSASFFPDSNPLPVGAGFFLPDMLVLPAMLEQSGRVAGDQRMRVLAIIALATLLAGCNGDRIKQSKNSPQEQRHFGLLA